MTDELKQWEYDKGYDKGYEQGYAKGLNDRQDTVPFDLELYQAGLMGMPNEMIEVLDKIRAEIEQLSTTKSTETCRVYIDADDFKKNVLEIIDKYTNK